MIYIHTLNDLNPKSVEIEVVPLLREIKNSNSLPLSEDKLKTTFSTFFISTQDLEIINKSIQEIPLATEKISELLKIDGHYEPINVSRAISMLNEVHDNLKNNNNYINDIFNFQESFIKESTSLLNAIHYSRTNNDKTLNKQKLSGIFEKILRNQTNFKFNFSDIIHEAHLTRIRDLAESLKGGFLFHITIEEELNKTPFSTIRNRIPKSELEAADLILQKVEEIKKGIETTYNLNMKMINMSIFLYTYLKFVN